MEQESVPSAQAERQEWFLFLGDDYRGPLTWQQVQDTVATEAQGREVRVWKEGMVQWLPFQQVNPFTPSPEAPNSPALELDFQDIVPAPVPVARSFKMFYVVILLVIASSYGFYTYRNMTAFLQVHGISREEYKHLRQTALTSPERNGYLGTILLVRGSEKAPQFHVASNLPEGSEVEIRFQGIPETLVDVHEIVGSARARIHQGYTRAQKFRLWHVEPLPRGDYNVWLLHKDKIIAHRTIFLGGPKDDDYKYQLDLYHATIRLQAQAELEEIRQLTVALGRQLRETKTAYRRGKKWWPEFRETWLAQQEQTSFLFKNWVPKSGEKGFYYGHLYRSIRDAGVLILKFHNEQNAEIEKANKRRLASEKLTEQEQVIEKILASIRQSITVVEQKAAAGELPINVPAGSQ